MFAINGLHIKNFKVFSDLSVDFTDVSNKVKPIVIVYGANGGGKTSLMEAIAFIQRTMLTMKNQKSFSDYLSNNELSSDRFTEKADVILDFLKRNANENTLNSITKRFIKINADGNMVISIDFSMDNTLGSYYIENSIDELIKEELYLTLNKNKIRCFSYENGKISMNNALFSKEDYLKDITSKLNRYLGKHSFLSIIYYEMFEKNSKFIYENINNKLIALIRNISEQSIYLNPYSLSKDLTEPSYNRVLNNIGEGVIGREGRVVLDTIQQFLSPIMINIFNDVTGIRYETDEISNGYRYKLYLLKKIDGIITDIPYNKESTGVKRILGLLPYLMSAIRGNSVIIDEFGEFMHEVMARGLLTSLQPIIKGQLIVTTHLTGLLRKDKDGNIPIPEKAFYFISSSPDIKKEVKCLTDIEKRIHKNYNYQEHYFYNELFENYLPVIGGDVGNSLNEFSEIGERRSL